MSARLVQTLHGKLGNEGADDMMAWMEETQRSGRQELRELMDLKLERFDARMGERVAELRVEVGTRMAESEKRLAELRLEVGALRAESDKRIAELKVDVGSRFAETDKRIAELKVELTDRISRSLQWNVVLWLTTLAAIGALRFGR